MAKQDNIIKESMLRTEAILHGTYRIDGYLSSGSFGNTYMATHVHFNEKYAIKEFFMKGVTQRTDNSNSVEVSNQVNLEEFNQQLEKFKKEARRLRALNNDHIVRVHDLFEENGTAYYVMDYIDGEDLSRKLERSQQPLSEAEVTDILEQSLSALIKVHSQGIWHLDLKPANIMVDGKGIVKLIDFGASKQSDGKKRFPSSTAVAFTNGYAPIEQMEKSSDKFGPWTDFYALGATLYNLLSNKKPPMPSDINDDHTPDKRIALPLPESVSDKMRNLILWLMKPNYKERPQSVNEIQDYFGLPGLDSRVVEVGEETLLSSAKTAPSIESQKKKTWLMLLFGFLLGALLTQLFSWAYHSIKNKDSVEHTYIDNLELPDGVYSGVVIKGTEIRDGFGCLVSVSKNDTTRYEGEWNNDRLKYGTRTTVRSVYTGQFDDDLRNNGFGIIEYTDEYIETKLRENKSDSEIIIKYVGNWENDLKQGLGRSIKRDGTIEFGEYNAGELKPVTGSNYKVGDMVYGVDVSHWQDDIDWDNLALYCDSNGIAQNKKDDYMQPVFFVYLKATEGSSFIDKMYSVRKIEAERHGIVKGAYHFFRTGSSVDSQLKNFFENVTWTEGDLRPALDVEDENEIQDFVQEHGMENFQDMVLYWLEAVEKRWKVRPIIYTGEIIRDKYLNVSVFDKYEFWVSSYSKEPSFPWQFWQTTEKAIIRGVGGNIDVDRFEGDYYSFKRYIDGIIRESRIGVADSK